MPFDPAFPDRIEYPKWVCGELAADADEGRAIRAAAAEVMAIRPAVEMVVSAEAAPLEPEPARPASSAMCPTPPPGTGASGRPPSSSGERMRRMRERQRGGRRAIILDVTPGQVEALVQAGHLEPAKRDDAGEIARSVGRLLDRHVTPAARS